MPSVLCDLTLKECVNVCVRNREVKQKQKYLLKFQLEELSKHILRTVN